ncbi:Protein of uncharacterised function (DUF551) [Enterobacter hormaechei]|uniref:DUF551 domain-containing protein n=1 Tax=Enterobacter hormaechei TaxID=158836 RepID=UPI000795D4E8|nr:DUF551 domain-containing protein [Enterobacter hormaechei]CZU88643.1 Protein of uncharacterised function (DUF551) [Enterobacter hormaechei]
MSNINKQAVQAVADLKAGYTLCNSDVAILNELARIALASLTAEPVLYAAEETLAYANMGELHLTCLSEPMGDAVIPLYAAPPAPVSVPAAMEMDDDFDSAFEHGKAVGWNAYRAAMLQSFGNSEQLNSPVIPDGWVACSERMPEEGQEVIIMDAERGEVISGMIYQRGSFVDCFEEYFEVKNPPYWMPLPAAPQQEVKP